MCDFNCFFFEVLEMESRDLCMQGKCSTSELQPSPSNCFKVLALTFRSLIHFELVLFGLLFCFVWDKVLICIPGWPGTHYISQTGLKLTVLPHLPECWDYRHLPPLPAWGGLELGLGLIILIFSDEEAEREVTTFLRPYRACWNGSSSKSACLAKSSAAKKQKTKNKNPKTT
jgi:hypothetical protein